MKQKRSKLLQFVWGNITMALDYVTDLESSVPPGSTLGPLLYLAYASELWEVAD